LAYLDAFNNLDNLFNPNQLGDETQAHSCPPTYSSSNIDHVDHLWSLNAMVPGSSSTCLEITNNSIPFPTTDTLSFSLAPGTEGGAGGESGYPLISGPALVQPEVIQRSFHTSTFASVESPPAAFESPGSVREDTQIAVDLEKPDPPRNALGQIICDRSEQCSQLVFKSPSYWR
jgi:hypothetical protein